jgi:hypothetical protein
MDRKMDEKIERVSERARMRKTSLPVFLYPFIYSWGLSLTSLCSHFFLSYRFKAGEDKYQMALFLRMHMTAEVLSERYCI